MTFESKYVAGSNAAAGMLRHLLATCRQDGEHPTNRVHSVYFDTPDLDALGAVDNGDYLKTKVRVRWYADTEGESGTAFVESKRKVGARRDKQRVPLPDLEQSSPLHHSCWLGIPQRLRLAGHALPSGLMQPTLHISYRRHRFVEPATGLRLALDTDIRIVRANLRFNALAGLASAPAPLLVFEAKGGLRRLPAALAFIRRLGARRQSFSKYGLWNHLMS
ncbi:MAG: polyphosphate polymerase domain-containing protein [Planctomycetes bacterium]|nr:polyphosphate polymerase domain-containing protein [Planctomycetota bacterium]